MNCNFNLIIILGAFVVLTEFLFNFSDEFRSKVACENDVIHLKCNPNSRIAVYSASYGRTEYESIQCPQPQGVQEESEYIFLLNYYKKIAS